MRGHAINWRWPRRFAAIMLVLVMMLAAPPRALAYDPQLHWYTVETPHFVLHFHQGLDDLAQYTASALEAAHQRLVVQLGNQLRGKVQVVLSDETDAANGSASVFIRPTIHIMAVPPDNRSELNDYQDFIWNVAVHEYTHILQLGTVSGVPALVNRVMGDLWLPNGFQPQWIIEGQAVYQESAQSGSGREFSSLYDMELRTELLSHHFYGIDDSGGSPTTWPRGSLGYLHGSRFLGWLAKRYTPQAFAAMNKDYGGQIIPFAINLTAQKELGADYLALYRAWQDDLQHQVDQTVAQVQARAITEPARLTFSAENTGEPVFISPDRLLYLERSADRRPGLYTLPIDDCLKKDGAACPKIHSGGRNLPSASQRVRELYSDGTLAVSPDKKQAIISQSVIHREFYYYEDLFRVDLATGRLKQITFGQRLTEPDFSPDGQTLVAAQRLGAGRMALVTLPVQGGTPKAIYVAPERCAVYTPKFSPNGRQIAFSEQRPAGRDLRLLDLATGQITDLTQDRALDLDPAFDPSGRYLFFSSDRSGIYNLYARDLESGETFQVTNVLTGAFRPAISPDARLLAMVTYSTSGYDVATLPLDPNKWQPSTTVERPRPSPPPWEKSNASPFPVRAYRPMETIWPRYWMPVMGVDPRGSTVGFYTSGSDIIERHLWTLQAEWGVVSGQPAFDASYTASVIRPTLGLNLGSHLWSIPGAPSGAIERQSHATFSASFPYHHYDWAFSASLGYELRYYDPIKLVPYANGSVFVPESGLAASALLGLGYSDVQSFPSGISPERGQALNLYLRGAGKETGSQFRYLSISGSATRYLLMPWLKHHVIGWRLSGGIGWGDLGQRRIFSLGGLSLHDPLMDMIMLSESFGVGLRGYRPGSFFGNAYLLSNGEYRFPMFDVNAGPWTLPVYLRRIHGAMTFDLGYAANRIKWRDLKPSVGAEIRSELVLGYNFATTLRLGYARGLGREGIDNFFVTLGSSY